MANRYAITNGNWSNPAIWDSGLGLPQPNDDVDLNNKNVILDQDIIVNNITGQGLNIYNNKVITSNLTNMRLNLQALDCNVIINGNVKNNSNFESINLYQHGCTITINGNLGDLSSTSSYTTLETGGYLTTVIVNGNVYGGNVDYSYACRLNNTNSKIYVNGSVYVNNRIRSHAIFIYAGEAYVDTIVACNNVANNEYSIPIYCSNHLNSKIFVKNMVFGVNGHLPFYGRIFILPSTTNSVTATNTNNGQLFTIGSALPNYPNESDVRKNVTYAFNTRVGTMNVPSPSTVLNGVDVDNTVGTINLDLNNILSPQVKIKLQNLATTDEVCNTIISTLSNNN